MSDLEQCLDLLEQAERLRWENPRQRVALAETARDLAASLDRKSMGYSAWLALQAEAWSALGSAYREVGRLHEAEAALNIGLAFLENEAIQPALEPAAHARLAQRAAYLRRDQRRFAEGLGLIAEAISAYERLDEPWLLATALIDRGVILGWSGKTRQAIEELQQALELPSVRDDPQLRLAAVHNIALFTHESAVDAQGHQEAIDWIERAVRDHTSSPHGLGLSKLRYLLGVSAIQLGRHDEGCQHLEAAHHGFKLYGASHLQAITLLELAAAKLALGHRSEVRGLVGQLFPLLRSPDMGRDALTALMLFYRAVQAGTATADLARKARRVVRSDAVR